jgi:hypothetical protein
MILLVTDFVKLKIMSIQLFRGVHKDRVYIYVFIDMSVHTYMRIYVYIVFLTKKIVMYCEKLSLSFILILDAFTPSSKKVWLSSM